MVNFSIPINLKLISDFSLVIFFIPHKTSNTFFDKQLLAINYKAPYDKKLVSDSIIEDTVEILDEMKEDDELNPEADEDLSAMINDIDVDIDKDDLDEDGDMPIPENLI